MKKAVMAFDLTLFGLFTGLAVNSYGQHGSISYACAAICMAALILIKSD